MVNDENKKAEQVLEAITSLKEKASKADSLEESTSNGVDLTKIAKKLSTRKSKEMSSKT